MYDFQHGDLQSDSIEDALYIQVHDLGKCRVRMRIELLTPCRPSVSEQYVNMIRCLRNFLN